MEKDDWNGELIISGSFRATQKSAGLLSWATAAGIDIKQECQAVNLLAKQDPQLFQDSIVNSS